MPSKQVSFDDDGDLLLRLVYPPDDSKVQENAEAKPPNDSADPPLTPISNDIDLPHVGSTPPENEVHMLVSSKHLKVASPVFRAMFKPDFCREGELLKSRDIAEMDLPDDDPEPFEVLMNVLHGRVRQVPEQINLQMLAKLSILVDKYQILEPLEIYLRLWMPELNKEFPEQLGPDMLTWLNIAWVFKFRIRFETLIRMAIKQSRSKIEDELMLPLPEAILVSVDTHRQKAICDLLAPINSILASFNRQTICTQCKFSKENQHPLSSNATYITSFACDGMVMGTMIKSLSGCYLWPLPQAPYEGLSVQQVAFCFWNMTILSLEDIRKTPQSSLNVPPAPSAHGWRKYFTDHANRIEAEVKILDLDTLTSMDSSHWQKG